MNIKEFKKGDLVTRNEPVVYKHNGGADSSYCGARLELIGFDEKSKIIILNHVDRAPMGKIKLSWAIDAWNEGWEYFPEILYGDGGD